jgi:hypothetical protein
VARLLHTYEPITYVEMKQGRTSKKRSTPPLLKKTNVDA